MFQNIHVKNMALIDEADVDFGGHLNILTGETGAGKSIIIGSISTALGGKVSRDVIRKDAEYALVELNFKVNILNLFLYQIFLCRMHLFRMRLQLLPPAAMC